MAASTAIIATTIITSKNVNPEFFCMANFLCHGSEQFLCHILAQRLDQTFPPVSSRVDTNKIICNFIYLNLNQVLARHLSDSVLKGLGPAKSGWR